MYNDDAVWFASMFNPLMIGEPVKVEDQQTEEGGYTYINIRIEDEPSLDQLIAFEKFINRMETKFPLVEESGNADVGELYELNILENMGADFATLYHIAKTQFDDHFEELDYVDKTFFATKQSEDGTVVIDTKVPNNLTEVSAERFVAYAETIRPADEKIIEGEERGPHAMRKILGDTYYKDDFLNYDPKTKTGVVKYEMLAKLAGEGGNSLNFAIHPFVGPTEDQKKIFQAALDHFRNEVVLCEYKFSAGETKYKVEAYLCPASTFIEIKISRDGKDFTELEFENEETSKTGLEQYTAQEGEEVEAEKAAIRWALFYFRHHLSTLGSDKLEIFDKQITI